MDAESFQKLWEAELKARPPFRMIPEPKLIQTLIEMMAHQAAVMEEMCEHLRAIREATETEAVEDAEPDPFQTLNGLSKDPNPLRYGVKGEYGE